jgi:recombination protein RecT
MVQREAFRISIYKGGLLVTKALTKKDKAIQSVSDVLQTAMADIKDTIPTYLSPERLTKVFLSQCRKNPKLLECDAVSLVKAFTDAGEIGLEPDGINAHLIPYGKEVTYMVDYKGMIRLARLSGEIADMTANVVYTGDKFSHEYGSNKHLSHIKCMKKDRGKRMCAYSYVKYKDGSEDFRVLTEDEIMHAKQSSKTAKIWNSDPDPMWAKTAVRQHSKFLPKMESLDRASKYIEDTELREITDAENMTVVTDEKKTALIDKIKEKQNPEAEKPGTDKQEEALADGDFRSTLYDFCLKNDCEKNIPDVLTDLGYNSIDDITDTEDQKMVLGYFKDNFTKEK